MAYLPCMNPSCKSHGQPHPNCKCWAGEGKVPFAKGGSVESFCSQKRSHLPSCEHHFSGEDPEHAVPSAIAHLGLLGLSNKGEGSLFDDIGSKGLGSGLANFASHVDRGDRKIKNHIEAFFDKFKSPDMDADPDDREKAKKLIAKGLINQQIQSAIAPEENVQAMAGGGMAGESPSTSLSQLLPVHNMMLHSAKGRAHGYLNSLRPHEHAPKLAFDKHMEDPEAEKHYNQAIDVSNNPLSVLSHARKGTLLPEHMRHLNGMYPELKQHLDKKLTERVTKAQLNNEKPPYHSLQSLSMFLGAPLSGEMTPQSIMAAQATFQPKQQSQQSPAQGKNKKGTSALSKIDDNAWTADQAAEKRQTADR